MSENSEPSYFIGAALGTALCTYWPPPSVLQGCLAVAGLLALAFWYAARPTKKDTAHE